MTPGWQAAPTRARQPRLPVQTGTGGRRSDELRRRVDITCVFDHARINYRHQTIAGGVAAQEKQLAIEGMFQGETASLSRQITVSRCGGG